MVARTPPKQKKVVAALNPVLIKETLKKVDQCMVRLQELRYTVAGGTKLVSGVSLSPRSTRGYLRTSLRCKQESVRLSNGAPRRSPPGKFPRAANSGAWMRMSLPAMLVGETVGEILQASQFAREIASAVARKTATEDPKTPLPERPSHKVKLENTELKARRKKEKQVKLQSASPPLQRARSRINFKVSPPKVRREFGKENNKYLANRVSPRNRPWASKTVLFPDPLFLSTSPITSSRQQQFCRTKSPVISRNRETTTHHKFLIKCPSPTRPASLGKSSPERTRTAASSKWIRPFSPSRLAARLSSPLKSTKTVQESSGNGFMSGHAILSRNSPTRPASAASKLRRSFSPSRLASRLISPLKSKRTVQPIDVGFVSGLKQRPATTVHIPPRRI